jgi:hypothetical protein
MEVSQTFNPLSTYRVQCAPSQKMQTHLAAGLGVGQGGCCHVCTSQEVHDRVQD